MPGTMDTSFLQTQVTTIIGQLHSIFDEIGVPRNDRESRETELFTALSEALNNQLRLANGEKNQMTEEAQNIINTIKQMEKSLEDAQEFAYQINTHDMKVTYPLIDCLRDLKEKYNTVSRLHRERFEQVKKLVQALESYSSHLESSFVKIKLPPTNSNSCPPTFDLSPSYVATLDDEFTRVYDEYNKRINLVQTTAEEIVRLWSDLGVPQAQTDSSIVQNYRESPEQLGLHMSDIDRLRSRRDKLLEEKRSREKRLKDIRTTIEGLWDRLGVPEADRKVFLAANRGCGLRTINEFEDELAKLNELKRQNLHLFVEDARVRIQELWDALYFAEEEMLDFTPAFSDVYSDALLSAHEAEIERLIVLKDQRAPILAMIERHKSLLADREALSASAADASRLLLKPQKGEKRDPGKLLREEKMRKRIAKELPKVAAELTKTLQGYEDEFGRPFLVHGEPYLDELEMMMEVKAPPPRSKTPNGLPPRSKTPGPTPTPRSTAPSTSKPVQPPRPKSVIGNSSTSRTATKTPASTRPQISRAPTVISQPPSRIPQSPSKIPSRAPLSNLPHGGNSPERQQNHMQNQSVDNSQCFTQHNFAQSTRTMGPPRAPAPRMKDLFEQPTRPALASSFSHLERPASVLSSSTNNSDMSSKYVRPISPEDVYDDRERMSYMSASMINREKHYQQHDHSVLHKSMHTQQNPARPVSRQTSNTSSNLTTGTTANGSENWETYSDTSDMDPEAREYSQAKMHGKRLGGAYSHMAPPPKMRVHERIDERDENVMRVGSDAAWTECSETF